MREGQIQTDRGAATHPLSPRLLDGSPYESLFEFLRDNKAAMIFHAASDGDIWYLSLFWFGDEGFCESAVDGRDPEDAARAFLATRVRERAGLTA